ncbi:MAG: molybdopterin-dependent oxidoreductase, partial [Dehalococcoidia bacterium]
ITTLAAISGNTKAEGFRSFRLRQGAFIRVADQFFKPMPLLQMYEAIMSGQPYPVKVLWLAEHNLMNQDVDNNRILNELVPRLDFIVVADMFMNASAQYADIVLPVCSFYEHLDLVPPLQGPNIYLQISPKVIEPLYESKPDIDIVNELATRIGLGEHFNMSAEEYIELLITSKHPSMAGITLDRLKEGPVEVPYFEVPAFATASGRFEFYSERLKEFGQELPIYIEPIESRRQPLAKKYPLSYLTTHTRYGNHALFAEEPWLRELDAEPRLEIHPVDAKARDIADGDMVTAFNDRGRVKLRCKINEGLRPGVVNINQGWLHSQYAEGTHQALTHGVINPAQTAVFEPNSALYDNLCEVKKADKE